MRKIEVRKDIPKQYPSYQSLFVNGVFLGSYISGKAKKYLNPEKWADEQIKKRNKVIDRNISRLQKELQVWNTEKELINKQ